MKRCIDERDLSSGPYSGLAGSRRGAAPFALNVTARRPAPARTSEAACREVLSIRKYSMWPVAFGRLASGGI